MSAEVNQAEVLLEAQNLCDPHSAHVHYDWFHGVGLAILYLQLHRHVPAVGSSQSTTTLRHAALLVGPL